MTIKQVENTMKITNIETKVASLGKNKIKNNGAVNTPISKTSTILFSSLEEYLEAEKGKDVYGVGNEQIADFSYGIGGTQTVFDLQQAIAELDGADYSLITPSGLSAITTTFLGLLKSGDNILVPDNVYGPTRRFCNFDLKKFNITTTYYDPLTDEKLEDLINDNTKLILVESPGSLTFEVQNISLIAKIAKKHDIIIMMDNSWGSIFYDAFDKGVDVVIQAGTKYIGGHSDLVLGTISTTKKYIHQIYKYYKNSGICASPDDCYAALKGIRTLPLRLKHIEKSALEVAEYLQNHEKVKLVLHPALESCPGHRFFIEEFKGSTGLFSIILDKKYSLETICQLVNSLKLFGIGASWGGYESLVSYFDPAPIRTLTKWPHEETCLRFYIGLENTNDLIADIEQALIGL